ncbi:MAG: hypothetical protein R2762_00160 [Bryobacteraceae bacterium]
MPTGSPDGLAEAVNWAAVVADVGVMLSQAPPLPVVAAAVKAMPGVVLPMSRVWVGGGAPPAAKTNSTGSLIGNQERLGADGEGDRNHERASARAVMVICA